MKATFRAIVVLGFTLTWGWCDSSPSMAVQVWADRTTVYPGDQFHYVTRVEHPADIEIVKDRLQKDQLSLEPFRILNIAVDSGNLSAGRRYFEVKLLLTTYALGNGEATVPSFNLFYFRRRNLHGNENTAAETLPVPALTVGLRSTIVDPDGGIREKKPVLSTPRQDWLWPTVAGLTGLLAVVVYGCRMMLAWARSEFWQRRRAERSRKKSLQESYEEIRQVPVDSPENVETFYARASTVLRGLAAERLGDCGGLTPRETVEALQRSGDSADHATALGDLMEECDLARYSPDGAIRAQGRHCDFLRKFENLVARH